MKMGFGFILGIIIIVAGVSIVLKAMGINIPLFTILIGLLFIYIGVRVISGGVKCKKSKDQVMFEERTIQADVTNSKEYNVLFGKSVIDLTNINESKTIEINTVFGSTDIFLSSDKGYKIDASSAFGVAYTPNDNASGFGTITFSSNNLNEAPIVITIHSNVVFGQMRFIYQ